MQEIAFSDQLIKFTVTDNSSMALAKSQSSIDNSHTNNHLLNDIKAEPVKPEKSSNLLINMQFELSEPYLITSIHLVSTYMEFSKANFEFYQAKQNQFTYQKINGIEKNAQNPQFIDMIKLEPDQCGQIEKLGQVQDEQLQNKEYQMKVLGIAQALKLQFQITSHTVMDVLVKFQNDHQNYSDSEVFIDYFKRYSTFQPSQFQLTGEEDEFAHNKPLDIDDALSLFKVCFESIQIYGYKLSCSPPLSHGVSLLNLSNIFRKHDRSEEAIETEILSGLSFMSSRKFVQASEVFIKAGKYFRDQYFKSISKDMNIVLLKKNKFANLNESLSNSQIQQLEKGGDLVNSIYCRNSIKQHFQLFQSAQSIQQPYQLRTSCSVQGNNFLGGGNQIKQSLIDNGYGQSSNINTMFQQTVNKNLIKAAKMELLAADSIVLPSMINQKVAAYSRAADSFMNMTEDLQININNNFDPYSALIKISPFLTKLALKFLSDKQENVQVAAVRALEFLVEQLGCTLGNQLPNILVSIFINYPQIKDEETTILKQWDISDNEAEEEVDDEQIKLSLNSGGSASKPDKDEFDQKRNQIRENFENEEDLDNEIFEDNDNIDEDDEDYEKVLAKKAKNAEKQAIRYPQVEEERLDEMEFEREKQKQQRKQQKNEKLLNGKENKRKSNSLQTLAQIRKKMEQKQKGNFISKQGFQHVQDNYHHFLETFINVLASASSQILRIIFQEIISVYILLRDLAPELRIYVFRIAEKILAICQGDVEIEMSFFHYMLYAIDGSGYESFYTESQITNIQYYALKLWETIKLKLVYNMDIPQLNGVINWVSEMLLALLEAEQESQKKDLQNILNKVYQLLDLVTIINIRYHSNRKNLNPTVSFKNDAYYVKQEELNIDKQLNAEIYSVLNHLVDNGEEDQDNDSNDIQNNKKLEKGDSVVNEDVEEETNIILKYFKKITQTETKTSQKLILINQKTQINVDNLIKPLILWIENSLQYQSQIDIFKNIWLVMVEIIPEESSINLFDIAYPLLERVAEHLQTSSPSHLMLEFIKIITSSLPKLKQDSQQDNIQFLLQFFIIFCDSIPHSVSDESFQVFDILLYITQLHLSAELIKKCIDTLIDKFTMKGKAQKKSVELFLRIIAGKKNTNSFQCFIEECLINNLEPQLILPESEKLKNKIKKKSNRDQDSKQFNNNHDYFQEKIQLLQQGFSHLQYYHFENLINLFEENILSQSIIRILNSGNSKVRIKAITLAKLILEQYLKAFATKIIQKNQRKLSNETHRKNNEAASLDKELEDPEFFQNVFKTENPKTLQIDNIQITKVSFCQDSLDNKLLFNSLIILDLLFQTIFSGPSVQNELEKYIQKHQPDILSTFFSHLKQEENSSKEGNVSHRNKNEDLSQKFQLTSEDGNIEFNNLKVNKDTKFLRVSSEYQELRLNEILDLIPLIQNLLQSPWSNIRSLTYGLLCYWVKPNIVNYKSSLQNKFTNLILDVIENLLVNQESECRTGGLNIIGSLCGLGYNFDAYTEKMKDILQFFRQSENIIPAKIWKAIYKIQFDWDTTNQAAALALIQLCAPRKKVKKFYLQMNKTSSIVLNLDSKKNNMSRLSGLSQSNLKKEDSFLNIANIFNKNDERNNNKRNKSAQFLNSGNFENQNSQKDQNCQKKSEDSQDRNNISLSNQNDLLPKQQEEDAKIGSMQEQHRNSSKSAFIIRNNEDEQEVSDFSPQADYLDGIFWIEYLNSKDIRDYISMFRNEYKIFYDFSLLNINKIKKQNKPPSTLWIERVNYNNEEDIEQVFQDQQEAIQLSEDTDMLLLQQNNRNSQQQQQQQKQLQQPSFKQPNNQNHQLGQYIDQDVQFQQPSEVDEQDQMNQVNKVHRSNIRDDDDEQLDLDQLGIINADDEDWNDLEENRVIMSNHKGGNLQSGMKDKENKNSINKESGNIQNKEEQLKQQIFIVERKKYQNQDATQQKSTSNDKVQMLQNFIGSVSPRDYAKLKDTNQKNQQTFPTDDDELDEEILESELQNKIEQNFNNTSENNELELLDDDYQYQPQMQQKLQFKQPALQQQTPANQKRQTYNLPTINSEDEFTNNESSQSHESKQYLQKLMHTNSDKKNKQRNLDMLASESIDDLIKLNENISSISNSDHSNRIETTKSQSQKSAQKEEEVENQKLSDREANDSDKQSQQQQSEQNEKQKQQQKGNGQKQQQQTNKNEKVFNINTFLMQDKDYIQQKMYQDQKQQLLKQSKMNNLFQNQQVQQSQQGSDSKNSNQNHINLQQQILQQQQLLSEAQSNKKKQAILVDEEQGSSSSNKFMQFSDSNSIQDVQFDIHQNTSSSQEKVENLNDQLYYISKTQESIEGSQNDPSNKVNNNQISTIENIQTISSIDSQASNNLFNKSQQKQDQQQKMYWENISLQLQYQQLLKGNIDQALQFSFQNSNANSIPQSSHPSALFQVVKKEEELATPSNIQQSQPKVYHSFSINNQQKQGEQNGSPNVFFEESQFQSAEFERSPDTERDNNINLYQINNNIGSSPPIARKLIVDDRLNGNISPGGNQFEFENENLNQLQSMQKNNEQAQLNGKMNDRSQELLLQQIASFQRNDKKNPIQYTCSSEDQVVLESNQTLDRPTSKDSKSSNILIDTFNNFYKNSSGLDDKQKKPLNIIGEVLEETKFTQQNNSGLIPTIKKKTQKKDDEGESNYFREGDSSRNNKKDEGIIEEFLTEEESSTDEQSQVKLKQRYASEPIALQPTFPLSSAQSPSSSLAQKSEEYFGRLKGQQQQGTSLYPQQSYQQSQQSTQQGYTQSTATVTGCNSTVNDIININSASSKNTKRSGNKSKERSNSPKHKKTQKKLQNQLQQTNNQIQQQQLYQQQLQQIPQIQTIQSLQQNQQQQPQQQAQYFTSENLSAFQTPLLQKSLTPSNRAKEIAFRRNSNSSQKGLSAQSNGENFTSKKRLNMNDGHHLHHIPNNQYMNNSSNSKHNKTSESGGNNTTGGKYYKSFGYKLLTKNHSTNNIFNTSSLINTTQGSTSFNNCSAANLALSSFHNNSNSQNKINNISKDKLIKKLMSSKGLNASELKSVIKLHQQTQMFFNQPQNQNSQYISAGASSGDTKHRTRLSKSPQKNSRLSSHDSVEKNKKKSKSTSPFNERIELSPDENRDSYPHSLHISYQNNNQMKNSKTGLQFQKEFNNTQQKNLNINEMVGSAQRQPKKSDLQQQKNFQNQLSLQQNPPLSWQDDDQQFQIYRQNFFNQQINEEKNENSDDTSKATANDEMSHLYQTLSQQGRGDLSGKILSNLSKQKKSKSKEPLTINNENSLGIGSDHFFNINPSKGKDRLNSIEKELTVSLASSTKSHNISLKSKKSLPLNISGLTPSQLKTQPVSTNNGALGKSPQIEKLLTQGAASGNKQPNQNKRSSSSSKKQKDLSKSRSKKEIVILQNISQPFQSFNHQFINNTSSGYLSQEHSAYKNKSKNDGLNIGQSSQSKNKRSDQNISSQLKILQQSSKQQISLPSNDSYLPFDNQQQFFKISSYGNIKNSNYNEFMKNAYQSNNNVNNKEILDELNQTL